MLFNERAYSVVESGFGLHYTSTLTLPGVTRRDQGDYTCTARVIGEGNILGSIATESFPFAVTSK